jgi:methyl-accepting chemotaxis protein
MMMKLSVKLLIAFLAVGIIPAATTGLLSLDKSGKALEQTAISQLSTMRNIKQEQIKQFFANRQDDMSVLLETAGVLRKQGFEKLQAVHKIKKNQIEAYFTGRTNDISILSSNETVGQALSAFTESFTTDGGKVGGENWLKTETKYANWLNNYQKQYGYYDLFLISAAGDVVFTVCREPDFGENLKTGKLKDSSLGKCFAKSAQATAIEDFAPYAPSNNEPAAFLAAPIMLVLCKA